MRSVSRWAAPLAVFAALEMSGCAEGPPVVSGSTEETAIRGIVKVNGKPAKGGEVVFDASNINRPDARPRTATIAVDGSFTATTLVGENMVMVQGKGVPMKSLLIVVEPDGPPLTIEIP